MLAHPAAQASPSYSPSSPRAPLPSASPPASGGHGTAAHGARPITASPVIGGLNTRRERAGRGIGVSRGVSGPGGLGRSEAGHLLADIPQLPCRRVVAGRG